MGHEVLHPFIHGLLSDRVGDSLPGPGEGYIVGSKEVKFRDVLEMH